MQPDAQTQQVQYPQLSEQTLRVCRHILVSQVLTVGEPGFREAAAMADVALAELDGALVALAALSEAAPVAPAAPAAPDLPALELQPVPDAVPQDPPRAQALLHPHERAPEPPEQLSLFEAAVGPVNNGPLRRREAKAPVGTVYLD